MYSQQRTAIVLDHDLDTLNLPYNHSWKQVTLPNDFQNQLGVVNGDTLIIRPHMLAKPAACVVVGNGPPDDMGNDIVRVNSDTRRITRTFIGQTVLVEKFDVIPADEIYIEWYISLVIKKYLDVEIKDSITETLSEFLFSDLADLPLMRADRFITTITLPKRPDQTFKINYWIRKFKPGFAIVKLTPTTKLHVF
jgi:hypothetical protein